jgi:uncharacterized sulfatase
MVTRRQFLKVGGVGGVTAISQPWSLVAMASAGRRPNILWISCEDIGPHLGCYGDPNAHTPTLDRLASEGIRYENAYTTAGVCAPNRSSIIAGVYSTTLGSHHMRSGGEGTERSIKPTPPSHIRCFSEYLRDAGYYCTNNSKEDYNFVRSAAAWDESSRNAHWRNRPDPDQPFFAVFNNTGTHEGSVRMLEREHAVRTKRLTPAQRQDPENLTPPPYHPDTPTVRRTWARYYELITALDYWAGDLLEELEESGLAEDTIVFFWSDHGAGLPRAKRWLYDSGTHVPLIVRIPEKFRVNGQGRRGTVTKQLVSSVDFAPTVLNLVGLEIPDHMQGRPFLGPNLPSERQYVYAARDRMDERYDTIRMVSDKRYQYIRNYEPFKPYQQYMNTAEKGGIMRELHRCAEEGSLPLGAAWFAAEQKPVEEMYDLKRDPHEVNNLADKPEYRPILERLREAHERWMRDTKDLGLIPEPELVELEERYGSRYAVFREPEGESFLDELRSAAVLAGRPDKSDVPALIEALDSEHAAVRYWAVTGIGNLGNEGGAAVEQVSRAMKDRSGTVRVAAAKALFRMEKHEDEALRVLVDELKSAHEWVRLHAALALDGIGEKARPAVPALKEALEDTHNKYVVRVANHALNELLGTNRRVR